MGLKLYAATGTNGYEYAVWANTKREAELTLGVPVTDQSTNKNLKAITTDRTKIYCRPLEDDSAEWQTI